MDPCLFNLSRLVRRHGLQTGNFVLSSGRESHYLIECSRVVLSASGAAVVAEAVCNFLREYEVDAIGGPMTGANAIVGAALAFSYPLRKRPLLGFLVRKESKEHGSGRLVDGELERGMRVAIVEDVTTTGASALRAVNSVRDLGCHVEVATCIVDRLEGASDLFRDHGVPFRPLLTIRDLGVEPLSPVLEAALHPGGNGQS